MIIMIQWKKLTNVKKNSLDMSLKYDVKYG